MPLTDTSLEKPKAKKEPSDDKLAMEDQPKTPVERRMNIDKDKAKKLSSAFKGTI